MDTLTTIVPTLDSIPLPAPVWLLKALLLITFLLHLLAMNALVGGSLIAGYASWRAHRRGDTLAARLYKETVDYLPTLVAATVTFGIAPLLFVQVLYGHLVYTANVAIGWFWWTVWILAIVLYYRLYRMKFHSREGRPPHRLAPWFVFIVLCWIAFVFVNNFGLVQQPERFSGMLLRSARGWWLNASDPATHPRYLHMLLSAIAVGGIFLMGLGRHNHRLDAAYGQFQMNLGYRLFNIPTGINILVGFGFMMALPEPVRMQLMGRGMAETFLWMIGMGAAIWAMPVFKRATQAPQSPTFHLGTFLMGVTLVTMVILRDLVRDAYLKPHFDVTTSPVAAPGGPIVLFFVTPAIGIGAMVWLLRTHYRAGK